MVNYLDILRDNKIKLIIDTPYPSEELKKAFVGKLPEVSVDAFPPAKFDENLPVIKGV